MFLGDAVASARYIAVAGESIMDSKFEGDINSEDWLKWDLKRMSARWEGANGVVVLLDAVTREVLRKIPVRGNVTGMNFTPDGSRVAVSLRSGSLGENTVSGSRYYAAAAVCLAIFKLPLLSFQVERDVSTYLVLLAPRLLHAGRPRCGWLT